MDIRSYWDFDDADRSEIRFRSLLDSTSDDGDRFEIECQIARTYSLRKRFEEAHAQLDRLLPSVDAMPARARACYFLERGRTYNSSGDVPAAKIEFEEAAKSSVDDLRIDAMHMLAIVASTAQEAEAINLRALEEAMSSLDPAANRWRGSLLNNLGWTCHDAGRFEEALIYFEAGLKFRLTQDASKPTQIAKWCVARCLRSLGRFDEALDIQLELVASGESDRYAYAELGEIYKAKGDDVESALYFAMADARTGE